jgi:outer membrane biosynthesis protein TonB
MTDTPKERDDKQRSLMISIGIHLAFLLLLIFLPALTYEDPPPGQPGVLVSFGMPNVGQGTDKPAAQMDDPEVVQHSIEETQKVESSASSATESAPDILTTKSPSEMAIAAAKEKQLKENQKRKEQEVALKRAQEEAERKRLEEEAAEKARYAEAKKQYGKIFDGKGKGNTNTPGNQGDPLGDPNANALEGISTGTGNVGGGLKGRGVLYVPKIEDKSQESGTVVVKVCVDKNGDVTRADYTQKGSTTTDAHLIDIAKKSTRKYKFTPGTSDEQCGTISVKFILQ